MKPLKILMFNHHPDVLHYMWRGFTDLGHDVYVATEDLTLDIGFKVSSTKNNKFEVVDQLYDPSELYPDMKNVKFCSVEDIHSSSLKEFDLLWSMMPDIKYIEMQHDIKTWFDVQMQQFLRDTRIKALPGIKSANHPDAFRINEIEFCSNWVAPSDKLVSNPQYITQLVTEADLVPTTNILIHLKNKGLPVKIHGGKKCPDGFIRDINILPETALLVHEKRFGINCYAVCKALDMGIPVYMSKTTKSMIGFGDLPDDLFYFSEEIGIQEAFEERAFGKLTHPTAKDISDTYRSIYTLERTKLHMDNILMRNFNGQ